MAQQHSASITSKNPLTVRGKRMRNRSRQSMGYSSLHFHDKKNWPHYCPCDSEKPGKKPTVSAQCLCEEMNYENELTMYFFNEIMKNVLVEKYDILRKQNEPKYDAQIEVLLNMGTKKKWIGSSIEFGNKEPLMRTKKMKGSASRSGSKIRRDHSSHLDFEDELTLYFRHGIMKNMYYEDYKAPVQDIFIRKSTYLCYSDPDSKSLTSSYKNEKEKHSQLSIRHANKNKYSKGHKRSSLSISSRSSKRSGTIPQKKNKKTIRKDLLELFGAITDDEKSITSAEKSLEQEWPVKRDENCAEITFKNGNFYQGEVRDKLPNGQGKFCWADGTIYEGQFEDGSPTGSGEMTLPDLSTYSGTFYRGNFHGSGVLNMCSTKMIYNGGWKYGKKHGPGWLLYEPGVWYEGEFSNDLRHGKGFSHFGKNSCYEGHYVKNQREGVGAMRWPNNDIYIGEWSNGNINGFGEYSWKTMYDKTFTFPVSHQYKGTWKDNKRNGRGLMFFGNENGAKMSGWFEDNQKQGWAVVMCSNGKKVENNPLFDENKPVHEEDFGTSLLNIYNDKPTSDNEMLVDYMNSKARLSQHTIGFPENKKAKNNNLKSPIEIQISSAPEEIDIAFYIDKTMSVYTNAFDFIQFDTQSEDYSSLESLKSNDSSMQWSKCNLFALNSLQCSKMLRSNYMLQSASVYVKQSHTGHLGNPKKMSGSMFETMLQTEERYLKNVILRHLPKLNEIYYHYATIASPTKAHFKHYMIRMFLWQLYMDIGITDFGISLVEIDNLLKENPTSFVETSHHPFEHIYFFQFVQSLLGTALMVHQVKNDNVHSKEGLTSFIFQKFLTEVLYKGVGLHRGRCLFEFKDLLPMKKVYALYLTLGEPHAARVFLNATCTRSGHEPPENKLKLGSKPDKIFFGTNANLFGHNFLYIPEEEELGTKAEEPLEFEEIDKFYQDLSTFRVLGPKVIVQCLCAVCPSISKSGLICDMDYPLTFLEFYEVLLLCALLVVMQTEHKKGMKIYEAEKSEEADKASVHSRTLSAKSRKKKISILNINS